MRIGAIETIQPDLPECGVDTPAQFPLQTAGLQAEGDILPYGAPGVEGRILEYENTGRVRRVDLLRPDTDASRAWTVEPGHEAEQCGFATATRSQ